MTYAQFGTIQASDYNTLVGANPGSTPNVLNTVWATGSAGAGYGQTAEANVSVNDTVTASKWANLVNKTASAATHQGSSISAVTAPASGGTVTYLSAIPTNLATIYTNRYNALTQSATTSNSIVTGTTWSTIATWTHTATFANGDAARYFFNSGGQLKITCSHPSGTGINLLFNNLASNVGTVVLSSITSGTVSIAGSTFNGITKVGGGNPAGATISTNTGYYALTTSNANVFTQVASTGPSGYLSTFIRVIVKSNGTVGSNGDVGNVITIYTVWDEIPNGLVVASGSNVTLTATPPEVTNIANSWGTITLAGSVTVS